MTIHAVLKLIPGCHLVRLKFGPLGHSSVIYAKKSMHSHKICKEGHLSVWHNLQLSEPSDIPDTCRRKCSLPHAATGRACLLRSTSSQRIFGTWDRRDNAFCATLNLLCCSSGCFILWIKDLYLFHLSREGDLWICITPSILTAVYYLFITRMWPKMSSGTACSNEFLCLDSYSQRSLSHECAKEPQLIPLLGLLLSLLTSGKYYLLCESNLQSTSTCCHPHTAISNCRRSESS